MSCWSSEIALQGPAHTVQGGMPWGESEGLSGAMWLVVVVPEPGPGRDKEVLL